MRNNGLSNRFSKETRAVWEGNWHSCHVCGMNCWNALHHILCPSESFYVKGEHNESAFNAAPVHNYKHPFASDMEKNGHKGFGITESCHVGNEPWLYNIENAKRLLRQTAEALEELGYHPTPNDRVFLRVYAHLYV